VESLQGVTVLPLAQLWFGRLTHLDLGDAGSTRSEPAFGVGGSLTLSPAPGADQHWSLVDQTSVREQGPMSSKAITPLQSRLQPCSGCAAMIWAARRSLACAPGQCGRWRHTGVPPRVGCCGDSLVRSASVRLQNSTATQPRLRITGIVRPASAQRFPRRRRSCRRLRRV